jgi:Zn-dependent peptidase ImmA (M78 family)
LDREADIFAEELLMPMPWMDNHKSSSINQLEKVFRVSKEVINIRYNNLFGKKSIN